MSIKGNIGQESLDLAATGADTVVINFDTRVAITDCSLHNQGSIDAEVWFFSSPDLTSASGKRVAVSFLASNDVLSSRQIDEIRQGYEPTENIIAVVQTAAVSAGDVNIKITYTEYTGDS